MNNVLISRRSALIGTVAAPLITAGALSSSAFAEDAAKPTLASPTFSQFKVGEFIVTTLLASTLIHDEPHALWGNDISDAEFADVSKKNFLPANKANIPFTPTLVNTGAEMVLFDTGMPDGGVLKTLKAVGVDPASIDVVVISHMHPDHIGGLMTDGKPTYPNARYVTSQVEYDFWAGPGADTGPGKMVASNVTPLADKMTFIGDGGAIVSGITGIDAPGHTPGHMNYMLESNGQQILLAIDTANHYVWSLAYPDWEAKFDSDKAVAAATRRKIFGMVAAEQIPFIGYHMPFPSVGYVETRGNGFHYVPETYQLDL